MRWFPVLTNFAPRCVLIKFTCLVLWYETAQRLPSSKSVWHKQHQMTHQNTRWWSNHPDSTYSSWSAQRLHLWPELGSSCPWTTNWVWWKSNTMWIESGAIWGKWSWVWKLRWIIYYWMSQRKKSNSQIGNFSTLVSFFSFMGNAKKSKTINHLHQPNARITPTHILLQWM